MNDASLVVSCTRPYGTNNEFELPIKVTATMSQNIALSVNWQKLTLEAVCTDLLWCPHATNASEPSWIEDKVSRVFTPNIGQTGTSADNIKANVVITLKNITSDNDYADVVQIVGKGLDYDEINAYILSGFNSTANALKYALQTASVYLYQ